MIAFLYLMYQSSYIFNPFSLTLKQLMISASLFGFNSYDALSFLISFILFIEPLR